MIDQEFLIRLVCLGCGVLLLVAALIVSAIHKRLVDGVLGVVTGLGVVGLLAVGAFGPVAVGSAIPFLVFLVIMLVIATGLA